MKANKEEDIEEVEEEVATQMKALKKEQDIQEVEEEVATQMKALKKEEDKEEVVEEETMIETITKMILVLHKFK